MSDPSRPDGGGVRELAPKPRWGRRFLKFCSVSMLLVFVAHWGWGKRAQSQMEAELRRYRAMGEKIDPSDFRDSVPPSDDQNAAVDLIASGQLIDTSTNVWQKLRCVNYSKPFDEIDVAIVAQALHQSRDALRRVELAMTKPKVYWKHPDRDPAFNAPSPTYEVIRELPGLLRLACLHAHYLGDDRESLLRIDQLLFIARAIDQDPSLIAHSDAMRERSDASEIILQIAPEFRKGESTEQGSAVAQFRSVIGRLMDDQSAQEALVRALEVARMESWLRVEAYTQGQIDLDRYSHNEEDFIPMARRFLFKPMAFEDALIMLDHGSRVIDAARTAAHWPGLKRSMPDLSLPLVVSDSPMLHCVAYCFMERHQRHLHRHFQVLTEQHLAATALAIRCYAVDHAGQLPNDLDDLVPNYLPALPTDPMSFGGKRLGYHPDPADPILYSVGDNERDDNGSVEPLRRERHYESSEKLDWQTRDVVIHLRTPQHLAF